MLFTVISIGKIVVATAAICLGTLFCGKQSAADRTDGSVDVTTTATPNGDKLPAANKGPVRSALGEPPIAIDTFTLRIDGLVDSPVTLTWKEILSLPAIYSDTILMYCVEGWEVWGNWKGISIGLLLEMAHVQPEGTYILFTSVDGYTTSLPVSYLIKYHSLLAYEVNGSPLTREDGFPLRLIAFGKYGYKWAKWVTRLTVASASETGFWESYGYSDEADVPLERRRYYEGKNAVPLEY